jgi:hypothetical protein
MWGKFVGRKMKMHICQNCKKEYPCPEPEDCDLPKRFGHCSEKCKRENFGLIGTRIEGGKVIALEYGALKR